jgi:hypothetical protein
MLTLELPVLVSVTPCVVLEPTLTLPKLREAGVADSCGAAASPIPLRPTDCGFPVALSFTESVPVWVPVPVGVKVTLMEQFALAASCAPQLLDC